MLVEGSGTERGGGENKRKHFTKAVSQKETFWTPFE